MTAALRQFSPGSIMTSLVTAICTFIVVRYIGNVGDRIDNTHDATTKLIIRQEVIEKSVNKIENTMMTRADMTVEFLKLQTVSKK